MLQSIKTNVRHGAGDDWSGLCAVCLVIYARHRQRITKEVEHDTGLTTLRFHGSGAMMADLVSLLNFHKYLD